MAPKKKWENMTPEERVESHRSSHLPNTRYGMGEVINTGDMTASLTLALECMKKYGGRPRRYEPTQEGLEQFVANTEDFFRYAEELNSNPSIEKKLILDIEAWTAYIGISRSTLFEYSKRGGGWTETINYVKNLINGQKKQLALSYKIPPVLYIFDACNNADYANASEFKITGNMNNLVIHGNVNELEREMMGGGLVWNSETGGFITAEARPKALDVIDTEGEEINADIRPTNERLEDHSTEEG